MRRTILFCLMLLGLPLVGRSADGLDEPPRIVHLPSDLIAEPTETVVRVTVQPMAAPEPALKYQLLPEFSELNPGNPVQGYLKCFMGENDFFFGRKAMEARDKWLEMPLKDLPLKELKNYGGDALKRADAAARLDTPDWQCLREFQEKGVNAPFADVPQTRELLYPLRVRFRVEIAGHRFDDAIVTAKTILAMSRHFGEHPALVGYMLGYDVADYGALNPIEEMIQQSGCPNLYWALSSLPTPLIDLTRGVQSERSDLGPQFAILDDKTPMTPAQVDTMLEKFRGTMQMFTFWPEKGSPTKDVYATLKARAADESFVAAARKRLVESGIDAKKVQQFPPLQLLLIDEKIAYQARAENILKVMLLPAWQVEPYLQRNRKESAPVKWLFVGAEAVENVRFLGARLERRIALLRCVEALRLYAADHDGRLPAQLADVPVPVPIDPITGKPFIYRLDGAKAIVRGSPPAGKEKNAVFNVVYEVTMRK